MKLLLILLTLSTVAQADDSLNVSRLGRVSQWSPVTSVLVDDTTAYALTRYSNGLHILNIADSHHPEEIGAIQFAGLSSRCSKSDSLLYVAAMYGGLVCIDVSDPANPEIISTYATPSNAIDVAIVGPFAYVVDVTGGLRVIDISNPYSPSEIGFLDTQGEAHAIDIVDTLAYLAIASGGLWTVNISDPANPVHLGSLPPFCQDVVVQGNYAYLALMVSGLWIVDISNPFAPQLTSTFDTPGYVEALDVSGNYLYVADGYTGVRVLDVSDPANPISVSALGSGIESHSIDVFAHGEVLAVADNAGGAWFVGIETPQSPATLGRFMGIANGKTLEVVDDYAVIADNSLGAILIDVSDPTTPSIRDFDEYYGYATGLASEDGSFFVTDDGGNLSILQVSDSGNFQTVHREDLGSESYHIDVNNNIAYVTSLVLPNFEWGLQVVDVSDRYNPEVIGQLSIHGNPTSFLIVDTLIFVIGVEDNPAVSYITILDISNPLVPEEISFFSAPSTPTGLDVEGHYCYLISFYSRMWIYDISDLSEPVLVSTSNAPTESRSIKVQNNYAFIASDAGQLYIKDVSNPANPTPAGYYSTGIPMKEIEFKGCYGYVVESTGMSVYDLSHFIPCGQPRAPENVLIEYEQASGRVRLSWDPVEESVEGLPITVDRYVVYESRDYGSGEWIEIGVPFPPTSTEFFVEGLGSGGVFYRIVAEAESW